MEKQLHKTGNNKFVVFNKSLYILTEFQNQTEIFNT